MLHTGGTETTAGENKVVAQFQAVVADLDPVADPVPSGATYYITAGFSLENEAYVWVGQVPVTTNLQSHVRIGLMQKKLTHKKLQQSCYLIRRKAAALENRLI